MDEVLLGLSLSKMMQSYQGRACSRRISFANHFDRRHTSLLKTTGDHLLPVVYSRTSCDINVHYLHAPLAEINGKPSAAVVHPKEIIRVGLGRHRLAFDRSARHQREAGRSRVWDDSYRAGAAGLKVGDKPTPHRGGGEQKTKQRFPVS